MLAKSKRTKNSSTDTTVTPVHTTFGIDVLDRSKDAYYLAVAIAELVSKCDPADLTVAEPYETLYWSMRKVQDCLKTMSETVETLWKALPQECKNV